MKLALEYMFVILRIEIVYICFQLKKKMKNQEQYTKKLVPWTGDTKVIYTILSTQFINLVLNINKHFRAGIKHKMFKN